MPTRLPVVSQRITVATDPLIQIYTERETLRCTACNFVASGNPWCKHLEEVVSKNLDGENNLVYHLTEILVPIFPSFDLWTMVHTDPTEVAGGKKMYVGMPGNSKPTFLGFLMPGEGRGVIRGALLSWATPQYDPKTIQCGSRLHGPAAEKSSAKQMADDQMKFILIWSLVTQGLCLDCHTKITTHDPSVIPDV